MNRARTQNENAGARMECPSDPLRHAFFFADDAEAHVSAQRGCEVSATIALAAGMHKHRDRIIGYAAMRRRGGRDGQGHVNA